MVDSNTSINDLNDDDLRVLFSFGYVGRYLTVNELLKEQALFPAIRLKNKGLLDYIKQGDQLYGINQKGIDLLDAYKSKIPEKLLFGAKIKR